MGTFARTTALAVFLAGAGALADSNDLRLYQLGNPVGGGFRFTDQAQGNFRVFARELGAALTSTNLTPPETLGSAGFSVSAAASVVWLKRGEFLFPTEGAKRASDAGTAIQNGSVLIPSVHIRKGLPYSFEIGLRTAWIEKSRMFAPTVEGRWALNEGFSYLPDFAIRGHASKLFNARDLDLTTAGLDLSLGKEFALGGVVTLTPYAGWNVVWVGAQTNTIDFRPERTQEEATRTQLAQLQDTGSFETLSLTNNRHNRFYGGLRFIAGALQIGGEFSYSSLGSFRDTVTTADRRMPPVLATNWTLGLDF